LEREQEANHVLIVGATLFLPPPSVTGQKAQGSAWRRLKHILRIRTKLTFQIFLYVLEMSKKSYGPATLPRLPYLKNSKYSAARIAGYGS